MPVQFAGIVEEHQRVRQSVGMFDISHMGKFLLEGDRVLEEIGALVPSDLSRLRPGQAKYTVFLNPEGGILDDLIVYVQGDRQVFLIVNAATTEQDGAWLDGHLPQSIRRTDQSRSHALIALQGPEAVAQLQSLVSIDLNQVKLYRHTTTTIDTLPVWIARTGYTGEDGFELLLKNRDGQALWERFLSLGITPCGLGARDTLRLEAAMALYGQDIDATTSPLEAGLDWLIHWPKPDFIGRSALLAQKDAGLERQLVGLEMEGKAIARHGYEIVDPQQPEQQIGQITSGSFAPTLGRAIALGYVPPTLSQPGQPLGIKIRSRIYPAHVVARPFYRRSSRP